jgi:hypothetical protein
VTNLLDIDVQLLLLRYGRHNVLQALARTTNQTLEQIEQQLQALAERKAGKPKRAAPSIPELAEAHAKERPDIAEPLRTIAVRFENRTLLPQLRDIQRLLERAGITHGKLKSRTAAAPLLLRTLAKLPPEELAHLLTTEERGKDSDYAILARAIMGTPPTKASEPAEKKQPNDQPKTHSKDEDLQRQR